MGMFKGKIMKKVKKRKGYRGVIVLNIIFAGIVMYEIVGYAWLRNHTVCIHPVVDFIIVLISAIDIVKCVQLWNWE